MQILLNGKPHELLAETSVGDLITELGLKAGQAAFERNREIVPSSSYDSTILEDNDEIEIVSFIGGG
ncbi:MAG: sulfur carrier protein ThiS [Rickettsiales bacterium]